MTVLKDIEMTLNKIETLDSGKYRLHADGTGFIDVRAKFDGWDWHVWDIGGNVSDYRTVDAMIEAFRQSEGMDT